jgi:hypothetical protein
MGKKINDTGEFPNTTPAADDFVLGVDVSNTANDANGEVVTFTVEALRGGALVSGANISELTNDAGYITEVTEDDVTAHEAALTITESQISDLGEYITALVSDTTPQLGGNLDVSGNKIVSTSDGDIDIEPNGTGNVLLGNLTFDADQTVGAGQDDYVLTYDHAAGTIALEEASGGGGGGGLVPIGAPVLASSDAAVDINLPGGYDSYMIRVDHFVCATDGQYLILRTSSGGDPLFDSGSSDYAYTYWSLANTTEGKGGNTSSSLNVVATPLGTAAGESMSGDFYITPATGSNHNIIRFNLSFVTSSGAPAIFIGTVIRKSTTAMDAIRFVMSIGNITSGTFQLYGRAGGA